MNIIDLKQAKQDRTPHIAGDARCLQCGHQWVATVPAGEAWIECPACHTNKGAFIGKCYPRDGLIWECACGNDLFFKTPDGNLCPICGLYQVES